MRTVRSFSVIGLAVVSVLVTACRGTDSAHEVVEERVVEEAAVASTPIDTRDQYTLLHTIEATVGDALTRDAGAMATVRGDWEGRRYRWEVAFVPLLCRSADACHVRPFDYGRLGDRRVQQGWMPQLELDAAAFADLGSRCAGKPVCVLDMEATMREFVFDPELATAVRFADVTVHGTRDAAATESWMSSKATVRRRA